MKGNVASYRQEERFSVAIANKRLVSTIYKEFPQINKTVNAF